MCDVFLGVNVGFSFLKIRFNIIDLIRKKEHTRTCFTLNSVFVSLKSP